MSIEKIRSTQKDCKCVQSEDLQQVADRSLIRIALQYGSTTRRDFRVIEIVLAEMIGYHGTQPVSEASGSAQSEAPNNSSSNLDHSHPSDPEQTP